MCVSPNRHYLKLYDFLQHFILFQIHTFVVNQNMSRIYAFRLGYYSKDSDLSKKLLTKASSLDLLFKGWFNLKVCIRPAYVL